MSHGFILERGSVTTVDFPGSEASGIPGTGSGLVGLNSKGVAVGVYSTGTLPEFHGFRYDHGVFTKIDNPNAMAFFGTTAFGINDSGDVVGVWGSPT